MGEVSNKYFIVYKITNKLNGHYYIGAHETTNLNDDYFGSGLFIKRAIAKEGIENFKKEIIHICESKEDMFKTEKYEISKNGFFPYNEMSYNLKEGGYGGWIQPEVSPMKGKHFPQHVRDKVSRLTIEAMCREDVRRKYLEANAKVDRSGTKNSRFGDRRIFISNIKSRQIIRIDKNEFHRYENLGWVKGRSEDTLKYFTHENAHKGDMLLLNIFEDSITDGFYRGRNGKFVRDLKIDQKYVHPSKRKSI